LSRSEKSQKSKRSHDGPPSQDVASKFTDYPFDKPLLDDIAEAGFESPLPVQAECIPQALAGRDVIGLAQTGTGKTAAFALPIIHRLGQQLEMGAVILAPTRELARQIAGEFEKLGKSSGTRTALVVGGIPIEEDYRALQRWPNVLVATPGRLIDHIRSKSIVLTDVKILVLDEADRMHDMGFIPQIRQIIRALPAKRQTMMFTATMPTDVEQIARQNMTDPVRVQIGRRSAPAERAEQTLYAVTEKTKKDLLLRLLDETGGRTLVFVRTKRGVERLASAIMNRHRRVGRLHSDRTQSDRDYAMAAFRDGRYRILIATDVAARGIDVADIEHVINFDFPHSPEDYVHRIGRTARVEASGQATTFVTAADARYLKRLERLLDRKIHLIPTPGCDDVAAVAKRKSSGRRGRSRGRGRTSSRSRRRGGRSRRKSKAGAS